MKLANIFVGSILLLTACAEKKNVDIVLAGAIYTCDSVLSTTEAIAIKGGEIVAIGDRKQILRQYSADNYISDDSFFIYPGFIDAHCHFSGYALTSYRLDLIGTTSFNEVLERVTEYEKDNKYEWIYGRGWDQNDWEVKEFPNKSILDSLFPNKPVILKRVDGHAVLCNQKALDMVGITPQTEIPGGMILKENGMLTGILIDNATEEVEKIVQLPNKEQSIKLLTKAEQECYSLGLTTVVDCGVQAPVIKILMDAYDKKELTIGNSLLLSQDSSTLNEYASQGFVNKGQIQINGIKLYADGALGSRGACLIHDYTDMPGHNGMMLSDYDKMREIAALSKAHNLQLCTHAIGDSANHAILRLYSEFLPENNDLRWRIEHAQVVDNQDYKWFSKYKIIPSVQPTHAISDMPWAEDRLGNRRIKNAYAYKELMKQNGWIPLGTDFPVEEINPIATFFTAVFRKDKNGNPENGFMKENSLSREEALLGMTYWAAKSIFKEKETGSIEIGKQADIIILDKNLMTADEQDILQTKVKYIICNGKIVYKKGAE